MNSKALFFLLTLGLFLVCPSVFAVESAAINLPNGEYRSSTRTIKILKDRMQITISDSEVIDLELQSGVGPTMPGDYLYMDKNQNDPQVIVGNCKQLDKVVCFFMVTQPELLVYEIEITNNISFLSVNIEKYQEASDLERVRLKTISEDFYPKNATDAIRVESLK